MKQDYIPCRELQHLSIRKKQACPLCGQLQTIMMRGKTHDIETDELGVVGDRGYSFCNCRNIFFTDWKNIDLGHYDDTYIDFVKGGEQERHTRVLEVEKQWEIVQRFMPNSKSLLNIGDYEDTFLDYLHKQDWNNMSLTTIDIIPRESRYRLLTGNFEDYQFNEKFDIVWMSHFMEHTKSPKEALLKAKSLLNPGGIIFNAMPDTHHINWNTPLDWHWLVQEHHTLWNMYDWIDFAKEECGLKCIYGNISTDVISLTGGGTINYWIEEARTIFKLQ